MGLRQTYTFQDYSYPAVGSLTVDLTTLAAAVEGVVPAFTVTPEIAIVSVNARQFVSIFSKTAAQVVFEHGLTGDIPPFTFTWRIVSNEEATFPATFYGSVVEAAALSGVDSSLLSESMQIQVNSWIDSKTFNGESFSVKTVTDEKYDIGDAMPGELLVKNLLLRRQNIISITSLTDDARSTDPTLVNSNSYVLDHGGESGIVKLESKAATGTNIIKGFTRGVQAVKISYTWGFATVPTQVSNLATLMLAKWGEINEKQTASNGLKMIEAGDYKEAYDMTYLNVRTKYDAEIKKLWQELREKYYNFV